MNNTQSAVVPHWVARLFPLAVALACLSMAAGAYAQGISHVEEDWELVLGQPDQNVCGPQVATVMSPFNDIRDTYFTFEINHRSAPYWTPGGLTIHHWAGEWRMQSYDRADRSIMDATDEIVTWTQSLDANWGQLTFQIKDGSSSTWGPFGYSGMFKVHTGWGVNNINSYNPDVSISNSGV